MASRRSTSSEPDVAAIESTGPITDTPMAGSTAIGTADQEQPLAEAGRQTVETAGQLVERATNSGLQQADRGREQTAEGLHQLASEIRTISTDMESQQPAIATVAEVAAEQTERIATYLRDTDARQLISNVEDVARRQPLLFVGGAFVLGLVAARFLKAAGGGGPSAVRSYRIEPRGYESAGTGVLNANGAEPIGEGARL
jgi:phosphohistidine phosphatase SixA